MIGSPKTLEERVRDQIGAEGPQFEDRDLYETRIDKVLENMTAKDLLTILSYTFDWSNLKQS